MSRLDAYPSRAFVRDQIEAARRIVEMDAAIRAKVALLAGRAPAGPDRVTGSRERP